MERLATLLVREVVKDGSPGDSKERFCFEEDNDESSRVANRRKARDRGGVEVKANREKKEAVSWEDVARWKGSRNAGGEIWWAQRPWTRWKNQSRPEARGRRALQPAGGEWASEARSGWQWSATDWVKDEDEDDSQDSKEGQRRNWRRAFRPKAGMALKGTL